MFGYPTPAKLMRLSSLETALSRIGQEEEEETKEREGQERNQGAA